MKIKTKNRIRNLFLIYLLLVMIIIGCLNFSVIKVRADSNYSNYLTSESISVKNDRALILLENSGSSNNYRNYYETSFLFPSRLRNEMYSTHLTSNPAKYYTQQVYLNDLDNEFAFKSVENLGQYETNDYIENYSEITENNGNFDIAINGSSYIEIMPNIDIDCTFGYTYPSPVQHYTVYDDKDFNTQNMGAPLSALQYEILGFEDISLNADFYKIQVNIHTWSDTNPNNFNVSIFNGISWTDSIKYDFSQFETNLNVSLVFNESFTLNQINDLQVKVLANTGYIFRVYALYVFIYPLKYPNHLQKTDLNYYNYISNGSGIPGLFSAEYSFTNDLDGSNPSDWIITEPIEVISSLDGHNKIVLLDGIGGNPKMYNTISSQSFGTIEFWLRSSDITKSTYLYLKSDSTVRVQFGIIASKFKYLKSSAWYEIPNVENPINNEWYHIELDFEFTSGNYKGLTQNRIEISINSIESNELITQSNGAINKIEVEVQNSNIVDYYLDAIDYSWSNGYYENRNLLDSSNSLNISSSLSLNRLGNSFDNLESLELEYTVKTNNTSILDLYLRNINSNNFTLIDSNVLNSSFQEFKYVFDLNYTYYSTLGIIDFMFYTESSNNLLISIDKINLKAIFSNFSINNLGYHNINVEFNRKTSGSVNRGNISLNLQLYKTNFTYDYIENNVIESDYNKLNQIVDFSNNITEIQEVEIQAHIRYGLNTLDIDIVNVYYKIIINYAFTFELFEQLRNGNNDGNYFRAFFSYDSMNFNRLNNTGIFGNYSTNCLSGLRVLRGSTDINYNRYFTIPYFDEKITLSYAPSGASGSGSGSEPRLPSGLYWTYETFKLSDSGFVSITVENWSVDFNTVYAEKYEAKYFYQPKTIKRSDLGSWHFKIGDIKISFNFIRNALADVINLILLFFQYIFFLVVASMSYILMYLGINILVLLWNIMVYYIFVALIWILWYLYFALFMLLYYIWEGLEWVYLNLLIPFYIWLTEIAIPYLVEFIIIPAVAFTITLVIWILTLGNVDFWELYAVVKENLIIFSDSFILVIQELIEHIVDIIIFIGLYLLLILLCMLKKIVVKARGFVNRANALLQSYEAYIYPIEKFYIVASRIKELITSWI